MKPLIKKFVAHVGGFAMPMWGCFDPQDGTKSGYGFTPKDAYDDWVFLQDPAYVIEYNGEEYVCISGTV